MPESLLNVESVSYRLHETTILKDICFEVKPKQIITLIGPNGAGKTTLLKILLGLLKPTTGRVTRRHDLRIGYMPQHLSLDTTLPINVERFLSLVKGAKLADIKAALHRTGVAYCLHRDLQHLSGGELQRIMLARALLSKPQLLVLDEPAQGVDIAGQLQLYGDIKSIRDELGCAIVLVSHDLHLVMSATDEVICLNQHICCSGHPDSVRENPAYLELFGKNAATHLAFYTHHHDHYHNLKGDVSQQAKDDSSNE